MDKAPFKTMWLRSNYIGCRLCVKNIARNLWLNKSEVYGCGGTDEDVEQSGKYGELRRVAGPVEGGIRRGSLR
ncbi:MAG: hypothetical protein P0119_09685 [Nitrospira sp.]|nr:hypothetical protein [Nitrospira sp.]